MAKRKLQSGFQHIAIEVADMDRSIEFYRSLLGLRLTERHDAFEMSKIPVALAFLRVDENHHDLVLAHNPGKKYRTKTPEDDAEGLAGFHHFGFEMPDRESWLAQLEKTKKLGHEIIRGPVIHSPWHPQGEGSWGENESFYVFDPDGHRLEIFCDMATIEPAGDFIDAYGDRIDGPMADEI